MFKSIKENATAEVVEKKSKFIANVFYVESREEAEEIIKNVNKQYHDARHNCYAYRVITSNGVIEKASDDGEPSGTAGAPMLTILSKNNLANVLVVVTRYFGRDTFRHRRSSKSIFRQLHIRNRKSWDSRKIYSASI